MTIIGMMIMVVMTVVMVIVVMMGMAVTVMAGTLLLRLPVAVTATARGGGLYRNIRGARTGAAAATALFSFRGGFGRSVMLPTAAAFALVQLFSHSGLLQIQNTT